MKATRYILSAIIAIAVFSLVGCKQDERTYDQTAAQQAVGVYVGQWHAVAAPSKDLPEGLDVNYDGQVEFKIYKDEEANVCFVLPSCSEVADFPERDLANIAHAGDDLVFNNDKATGMGAPFAGRIFNGETATMAFTIFSKVKVEGLKKPKTIAVDYTFTGTKVYE